MEGSDNMTGAPELKGNPRRPRHVEIGVALNVILWSVVGARLVWLAVSDSAWLSQNKAMLVAGLAVAGVALVLQYEIYKGKKWAQIAYCAPAALLSFLLLLGVGLILFLYFTGGPDLGWGALIVIVITLSMVGGIVLFSTGASQAWFQAQKKSLDPIDEILSGRLETINGLEDHRTELQGVLREATQARKTVAEHYASDESSFEELDRAREREATVEEYLESAGDILAANSELDEEVESARLEMEDIEEQRRKAAEAYARNEIAYEELEKAKEEAEEAKARFQRVSSRSLPDLAKQVRRERRGPSLLGQLKESLAKLSSNFQPTSRREEGPSGIPEREPAEERESGPKGVDFWGRFSMSEKVAFGSAIGVVLGGLGPWVDAIIKTGYGAQGDGWFLAVGAGAILYLLGREKTSPPLWTFLLFLGTGVFTSWKISDLLGIEMFGETVGWELMSWGLPVALASSVVGILATASTIIEE